MPNRWVIYQKERFPLLAHGPLVAAFSFSAVRYSSLLRGQAALPTVTTLGVAFCSSLGFFLLLRIADEFKDFEDDRRYRAYRPVPRGLIRLQELGWVALGIGGIQLALALWLSPRLLPLLALVWLYMGLMRSEFAVPTWLKAHPVVYLTSHMVIMPLIDLYVSACDWTVAGVNAPAGLIWFLLVSYLNGVVLEIGRKLRAPEQEEEGVETYTRLWGCRIAPITWLSALSLTACAALLAARETHSLVPEAMLLALLVISAAGITLRFIRNPSAAHAKGFELLSGLWTLSMYLSLGWLGR